MTDVTKRSVDNVKQSLSNRVCGMQDSPLHLLPPELRNSIWELVFDGLWDDIVIRPFRAALHPRLASPHPRLALLLVCKRINDEAQSFAWRNVAAAVGYERRMDWSDRDSDLEHTAEDAARLVVPILSNSGPRLASIVELTINHGGVLACVWDDWGASSCHDPAIAHATAILLHHLTSIRALEIHDPMAYRYHELALGSSPQQLNSGDRDYRVAREQLSELHLHLPGVTQVVIKYLPYGPGVTRPFVWQIEGRQFTHQASGTVWDFDDDVLDWGKVGEET
ncbi:hypothetical protein LTR95_004553 [Oleoguttula sp. CCFEE 5521]